MIFERTQSGKAIARTKGGFNEGRPKQYTENQLDHAMKLLNKYNYDGHLYGGIPQKNIEDLKILQAEVGDVLNSALSPVRDGYVKMIKPISELTADVLSDSRVVETSAEIKAKAEEFIAKYWGALAKLIMSQT